MSKDEARKLLAQKLLGSYATGSLTEAERTALFQAALEDQELFDELAGEQVLKEVLDEPGARQRLITALEPRRKHRVWLWATTAATLAVAVVIGIVILKRTPPPEPPQQIAQVLKSPEPAAVPVAPPAEAPTTAPKLRKVSPPVPSPAPSPAPAPPPEPKKEENAALAEQTDQLQQAKPQAAVAPSALRQFAAAVAPVIFGFNYTVGGDGFLVIVPTARGFLSVTANDSVLFPSGAVNAGTPIRIAIPSGATSLVIAFSAMPGIAGAPVRRDGSVGTVTDQDPPNGKILIQLFLTPAPR
jgi:hypothetical protein